MAQHTTVKRTKTKTGRENKCRSDPAFSGGRRVATPPPLHLPPVFAAPWRHRQCLSPPPDCVGATCESSGSGEVCHTCWVLPPGSAVPGAFRAAQGRDLRRTGGGSGRHPGVSIPGRPAGWPKNWSGSDGWVGWRMACERDTRREMDGEARPMPAHTRQARLCLERPWPCRSRQSSTDSAPGLAPLLGRRLLLARRARRQRGVAVDTRRQARGTGRVPRGASWRRLRGGPASVCALATTCSGRERLLHAPCAVALCSRLAMPSTTLPPCHAVHAADRVQQRSCSGPSHPMGAARVARPPQHAENRGAKGGAAPWWTTVVGRAAGRPAWKGRVRWGGAGWLVGHRARV